MLRHAMMNRAFLPVRTSRRGFLIGATAVAGGFAVGFRPVGALAQEAAAEADQPPGRLCHDHRRRQGDGDLLAVRHGRGQLPRHRDAGARGARAPAGTRPTWSAASGDPRLYGNLAAGGQFQFTGGSTSMASSWDRYRQAGATARAMLVAAAAEAVGRAGGRDRGGRREAHPPDGRQPRLRRARRAGGGDAGAGGGAAEGAGGVDADRQRGDPPLRRPVEDRRHPSVHPRREAPGDADRGDDPSAEVRRQRGVLRRRGGQGDARGRRRGADAARGRGRGRAHVGGPEAPATR